MEATAVLFAAARVADGQVLSSFTTTACKNATTVLGRHSGSKTVLVGSLAAAGLICALHRMLFGSIFSIESGPNSLTIVGAAEIIQDGEDKESDQHINNAD